jgi:hypothetical protein
MPDGVCVLPLITVFLQLVAKGKIFQKSLNGIVLSVTVCPRSFTGISANGRLLLVEV